MLLKVQYETPLENYLQSYEMQRKTKESKNKTNLEAENKYTSNSWLNYTDESYHICIWPWGNICNFAGYFVTI